MTKGPHKNQPRIGLFATCLVDLLRPSIGFATADLLERAGCTVEVPDTQTCCGQPAYNSGDLGTSRELARQTIRSFEDYDYVVLPSGSCAGTLRDYPDLFADDPQWLPRARQLAGKTWELTSFLVEVLGVEEVPGHLDVPVTYHDSCSGLRQLNIRDQPRKLLAGAGVEVREMDERDVCCGFGGTFCVKYPDLSERMVSDKVNNIQATDAPVLLGGDLGCLINVGGRLRRQKVPIRVYHIAEVLAGMTDENDIASEADR